MSQAVVFERYGSGEANKGVSRFAIAPEGIHVQFHDDRVYVYSDRKPGATQVQAMAALARQGSGLSTYISRHAHDGYERRYTISSDPSS